MQAVHGTWVWSYANTHTHTHTHTHTLQRSVADIEVHAEDIEGDILDKKQVCFPVLTAAAKFPAGEAAITEQQKRPIV